MYRLGILVAMAGVAALVATIAAPGMATRELIARADDECTTSLPPPAAAANLTPGQEAEIEELLATMPLEVKIGQMLMAGVTGTTVDDDARAMIDDLHIGNIILMGRNIENPAQVQALTNGLQELAVESNGVAAIIATDQEGGLVQRLHYTDGFTALPMAATVGVAQCPERARAYGAMAGAEMAAVGVNMDMAPDLDVNTNPDNPVIGSLGRSFGATAALVEEAAIPFMLGLHDAGVMSTGKHFPGHGATTTDSHEDLPFVDESRETLESVDIAPFRTAVAYGIDAVMPAHVVYPALDPDGLPATVSHAIQTGILRDEFGFDGMIITDDMGMKGITNILPPEESGVAAVLAGADVVLCVRLDSSSSCTPDMIDPLREGLLTAAREGKLSPERIDESVRRVLTAKLRYAVGPVGDADLSMVNGASHLRAVIDILAAVADRKAEEGQP
jgi:beta-N-acetylhexosaminidase